MHVTKRLDLPLLERELLAAGVPVSGLSLVGTDDNGDLMTYDGIETVELPPSAGPVVAAHVPPPRYVDYVETQAFDAKAATTDATATELWRTTLPAQHAYLFTAQVVGIDRGNGAALRFEAKYSVKRLNAGVVQIGSPVVVCDQRDAGAAGWVVAPAMVGNDVLLRVTGAAGRTVDWVFSAGAALYAPAGLGG
jgi:hypothetical protein